MKNKLNELSDMLVAKAAEHEKLAKAYKIVGLDDHNKEEFGKMVACWEIINMIAEMVEEEALGND